MKFIPSDKSGGRWLLWIVLTITATASFTIIYKFLPFDQFFSQSKSISKTSVIQTDDLEVPEAIAALGILEPQGEVIVISAPAFAEGARVDRLLVKRGDQVRAGFQLSGVTSEW
jgi:HlyD family secretion protein